MGERDFNERFWEKVKHSATKVGATALEKAFILYYAMLDPDTPAWAKSTIVAA